MVDAWVFVLLFSGFCIFEIGHKCILLNKRDNKKDNEIFPNLGKSGFYDYSMFLHLFHVYCFFPKSMIEEAYAGLGRNERI